MCCKCFYADEMDFCSRSEPGWGAPSPHCSFYGGSCGDQAGGSCIGSRGNIVETKVEWVSLMILLSELQPRKNKKDFLNAFK